MVIRDNTEIIPQQDIIRVTTVQVVIEVAMEELMVEAEIIGHMGIIG